MRLRLFLRLAVAVTLACGGVYAARADAATASQSITPSSPPLAPTSVTEATPSASNPGAVVAKVGDETITRGEWNAGIQQTLAIYRRMKAMGRAPAGVNLDSGLTTEQKYKVLHDLVDAKVLESLVKKADIPVSDKEVSDRLTEFRQMQGIGSEADLNKILEREHLTLDQFRANVKESLAREKFIEEKTKGVTVTDQEIEDLYNKMKSAGRTVLQDNVDVANILIRPSGSDKAAWAAAKKRIDAIRDRVTTGKEDFIKVAQAVSDDPNLKDNKAVFKHVNQQDDPFPPEFGVAAIVLPEGVVSEPFQTPAGWHIIKVVARHKAGPVPLADLKDVLEKRLKAVKAKAEVAKIIAAAKAKMNVQILVPMGNAPPALPSSAAPAGKNKSTAPNSLLLQGAT